MKEYKLIPYSIIKKATSGNVKAIGKVIKHYEQYINKKAVRPIKDDSGNINLAVDDSLKLRMRTKLIKEILNFKINRKKNVK
ncbi:helix-turn-helix domain-containing protein [Ligilactobacillus cholophilus]|uniref:helix-turn-helix domain-containing protein n=1 Tax=Ligilactobacillus cholophilus TaxID=3050131 RepID=UPI0025AF234D|nr:helix-turn-helix domain-containing protein [Ligilactobacillus cholophilus]